MAEVSLGRKSETQMALLAKAPRKTVAPSKILSLPGCPTRTRLATIWAPMATMPGSSMGGAGGPGSGPYGWRFGSLSRRTVNANSVSSSKPTPGGAMMKPTAIRATRRCAAILALLALLTLSFIGCGYTVRPPFDRSIKRVYVGHVQVAKFSPRSKHRADRGRADGDQTAQTPYILVGSIEESDGVWRGRSRLLIRTCKSRIRTTFPGTC